MFVSKIFCGVPKFRTPKPKKQTRKFSVLNIIKPTSYLIQCNRCTSIHHISTICLKCYENIRIQTNILKRQIMQYNPYVGERQKALLKK